MVFFYLFLTLTYAAKSINKNISSAALTTFFNKNINLEKEIYSKKKNVSETDYQSDENKNENKDIKAFTFKVMYLNYKFFIKKDAFVDSFKALANFFNFNDKFMLFFFIYNFLYNRFFRLGGFNKNTLVFLNAYFYDILFLCFYFFKKITFENNLFYLNKHSFFLKNTNKLKNLDSTKLLVTHTIASLKRPNSIGAYNNFFKKYQKKGSLFLVNSISSLFKKFYKNNVFLNYSSNNLKKNWKIVFYNNFLYKYICNTKIDNYSIYFLRKNRMFNKGRYSRNRQNYRTGVYWCLYVNIVAVLTIYYFFFRFSFNFGYLWWLMAISINCVFFSKFVKYKLYLLQNFNNNIIAIYQFYMTILLRLHTLLDNNFFNLNLIFQNLNKYNAFTKKLTFYFLNFYYFLINAVRKIV